MNENLIDRMFLNRFEGGLEDAAFLEMKKRHKSSDKILLMASSLVYDDFISSNAILRAHQLDILIKMVKASTMISTFEKLAFQNYMSNPNMHAVFLASLRELLVTNNADNFNDFVDVLLMQKHEYNANIAKWPIITFFLVYCKPYDEVMVKPVTIKMIAHFLNVDISYKPLPNFDTYQKIRQMVMQYKAQSDICQDETNIVVQAIMYSTIL